MAWSFERLTEPVDGGAGGVTWDGERVLFSLPGAALIMALDPAEGSLREHRRYTGGIHGLAVGPNGSLYGCQSVSRRIVRLEDDGSTSVLPYKLDGRLHNNPRELDVDSRGRIWFSDPWSNLRIPGPQVYPRLDHASVLRIERIPGRGWELRRMTFDTTAPRGVLVSADERTLFVSEHDMSPAGRRELRAYPIEDDALGPFTVLHTFGSDHRGPHPGVQGMCLDEDGNVVACAGGGSAGPGPMVYVLSPAGQVLAAEPAPADPVGCAFGGADLATLFVTTATGALYRVDGTGRRGFTRAQAR